MPVVKIPQKISCYSKYCKSIFPLVNLFVCQHSKWQRLSYNPVVMHGKITNQFSFVGQSLSATAFWAQFSAGLDCLKTYWRTILLVVLTCRLLSSFSLWASCSRSSNSRRKSRLDRSSTLPWPFSRLFREVCEGLKKANAIKSYTLKWNVFLQKGTLLIHLSFFKYC